MVNKLIIACLFNLNSMLAHAVNLETAHGVVAIESEPQRIAVYNIGTLDTLNALNVTISGAPEKRYIDFLDTIDAKNIGTVLAPNLEALYKLQPDLIIVGERSSTQFDAVKDVAQTVDLSLGVYGGESIYQRGIARMHQLAVLFNREAQAKVIEESLNKSRDATKKLAEKAGIGMMVMIRGKQLYLLGNNSLTGWIVNELDLKTIKDGVEKTGAITDVQPISFEYIAEHQPEWIIVVDRNQALGKRGSMNAQTFFDNVLIQQTPASNNQRVIFLDGSDALVPIGGVQGMQRTLDFLQHSFSLLKK